MKMKTKTQLSSMGKGDLVHTVLCLQKVIKDMEINEIVCSQIHNYHFAGSEILKLSKDRYLGSAILLGGFYSLGG